MVHVCHPSYRSTNRRSMVQAGLVVKHKPISKITNTKRTGGVAQAVEQVPGKWEALRLNTSTALLPKE
jgi:hypothetical protein